MKEGIWKYVRRYRYNSVFIKSFILVFTVVVLPLSSIAMGVHNYYKKVLCEELNTAYSHSLTKVKDSVDSVISNMNRIGLHLALNKDIERFWNYARLPWPDYDTTQMLVNVEKTMPASLIMADYLESIYVYFENQQYIVSTSNGNGYLGKFVDEGWVEEAKRMPNDHNMHVFARTAVIDNLSKSGQYITFMRKAGALKDGYTFIFNMNASKFGQIIDQKNQEYEQLFIIDQDNRILYDTELKYGGKSIEEVPFLADAIKNEKNSIEINGVNTLINVENTEQLSWRIISLISTNRLEKRLQWLNGVLFVSLLVSFIFSIVVSALISLWIYKLLRIILGIIDSTSYSGLKGNKYGELTHVINQFFNMERKAREAEEQLTVSVNSLHKAQTAALQSQINPHFLFNTLDAIMWKAMSLTGDENDVVKMVGTLSELMKLSVVQEKIMIPLSQELEHVRLYTDILKYRYGDRFELKIHCPASAGEYMVPRLMLQPLIENAIYHGIKPLEGKGDVEIIVAETEIIEIHIRDNGIGMTSEELEKIRSRIEDSDEDEQIGLMNVHRRIRLIFGRDYGMEVYSEKSEGTRIVLRLPKVK